MSGDFNDYLEIFSKSNVAPAMYVLIGPLKAAAISHLQKSEARGGELDRLFSDMSSHISITGGGQH